MIVALIMLLLISIIAIGGMQDTILQGQMTTNTEDRSMAFEGAEAALRAGEEQIIGGAVGFSNPNETEFFGNWNGIISNNIALVDNRSAAAPSYHLNNEPRCPELAEGGCPVEIFDVTSRGVGGRATTVAVLRSSFGRVQ